jgi:PPOX class probable F420-dependent enzyme
MTDSRTAAAATASSTRLPDDVRSFIEAPRFATIATLDADGAPHQAVIWYALEGDDLVVNSRVERHWPRNLDRDPRVSLTVYDLDRPYHMVQLKGRAQKLREGDAATSDIQALARRYGRNPDRYGGQARVSYRIVIDDSFDYES